MQKGQFLAVIAGALGYFVDLFDLLLYQIYRVPSLKELGVSDDELLTVGSTILNYQFIGLLLGGIFFGYLGDKLGRKEALFGTIALYSLATLLCAFVNNVFYYAILRFICGFGLAGELGAAVTLTAEQMSEKHRGWGVAILTAFGISGVIVASLVAEYLYWRHGYILGGVMGFSLLLFRLRVQESEIFKETKSEVAVRGDLIKFFSSFERTKNFLFLILFGAHTWAIAGVWMTFTPEISKSLGLEQIPTHKAVLFTYLGITLGDFILAACSQIFKSRLWAIRLAQIFGIMLAGYLLLQPPGAEFLYLAWLFVLSTLTTNWAVILLSCAERFGTNFRALATTSLPNFIRASAVISVSFFKEFYSVSPFMICMSVIACWCILGLLVSLLYKETYGVNLNYVEN
ncbi:MAG: MFS transporter [Deltaproteobacteria bacterium]|nr:MFS transporter [Deltaproteobacteria bacterium]